jgi:hypothetical protein
MAAEMVPLPEDDRIARARRVVASSTGACRVDFERGRIDGRRAGERQLPVPALWGGAYAVGFLCGYSEVQLRHRAAANDDPGPSATN